MNQLPSASCGHDTDQDSSDYFGSIEKGSRTLCNYCYNATVAESAGLKGFENARFDPMELIDQNGVPHLFHFSYRLFVTGVTPDANESPPDGSYGYQFRVIGPPEGDPFELRWPSGSFSAGSSSGRSWGSRSATPARRRP